VQWRIWEREAIEAGRTPTWDKSGTCTLTDFRAWLLHERDGLSFQEIGRTLFSNCAGPENQKMRAYRAHDRVEGEFHRGHTKRTKKVELRVHAFGFLSELSDR
jgi:hypothetical protein